MKAWSMATLILLGAISAPAFSQGGGELVMSLEECLSYAKEHSITLQQAKLDVEDSQVDRATAKSAFLPSLSASASQGFTNSPISSGDIQSSNKYSGSYGVDLAMNIYNGGENALNLKQSKLSVEIAKLGMEQDEDVLEVSIAQIYVEILYAIEQIEVTKNSIALSEKNIELGDRMLELGSMNRAEYAQLLTAQASEEYNLVVAQNTLRNKYMQLKHLLEITDGTTLKVDSAELNPTSLAIAIPTLEDVYAVAMSIRPEIASSTLSIESAKLDEKIARAGYLPTLSLSAGVGVNHISGTAYTFGYQLKDNYSNSIGLNLSVPIFNKFATRNAVIKSQNATKYASLTLESTSKSLYQTIETLHTNAVNAHAMYMVSQRKLSALEQSLELVTKQYELGRKSVLDLLTEQDDYRLSSQEYLESKYTLILNKALLEYYRTGVIKI
ncbi:MAG: TolC family protein [Rikenellaceae bacterium]